MKYQIQGWPGSYVVWLWLGRQLYCGKWEYTTRRAAVRGAKRAGGTEEIK